MGNAPPEPAQATVRDIDRAITVVMLHAREAVMNHFRPLLAERGYTEQQWRVLVILNEKGELEATALARYGAILMPSLTRIIKNLEDQKLIQRTKDLSDGRRMHISLTPAGKQLIASEAERLEAIHSKVDDFLGSEKTNQLLNLLSELAKLEPPQR